MAKESPKAEAAKTDPFDHARRLAALLAADPDVDVPELGSRLLVAVLLHEHGELGTFSDVKPIALELKRTCPMLWGSIRKGNYMPLPNLLKMHHRASAPALEYQRMMQRLAPPDPPAKKLIDAADSREARRLPPDVVERVQLARETRLG